jgi:hypothetical protein
MPAAPRNKNKVILIPRTLGLILSPCRRHLVVGSPKAHSAVGFADHHAHRRTPHPPERPPAVSPAGDPRPAIATQSPPSRTSDVKLAATMGSVLDSPLAAAPMRRRLTPCISSTSTTTAIASGHDEGRSPNDATLTQTAVPLESIAPIPPPQPTQSSLDAAIRSPCAPQNKFPNAIFPPLRTPRFADALDAILVKSYCATVDAPSDTVPCGQCLNYNGTLATCSVDCGPEVESNEGWTTIHPKSKKSKRGKSNVQSMEDQRTFSSGSI